MVREGKKYGKIRKERWEEKKRKMWRGEKEDGKRWKER